MAEDIKEMLEIYQTYEFDWMGQRIANLEDLTRHHIVKREDGGPDDISNYALLTRESHELLNEIEDGFPYEYSELFFLFHELNDSRRPVTQEYYDAVREIVRRIRYYKKRERRGRSPIRTYKTAS